MYESLAKHCDSFRLFIFAFDQNCYDVIQKLNMKNVTVISQKEFEDAELLSVKPGRSRAEYCWTCTPSTILYVLERYGVDICTYLDADIYFFSSPAPLVEELRDNAVIITEHRFTPAYDRTETSGRYNVQFLTFRNNEAGLKVLKWWRAACIESCELNAELKKCGDQKYLDDWMTRFDKVHILDNLGGGLAPWNVQQYRITEANDKLVGTEISTGKTFEIVFYHFQGLKMTTTGRLQLTGGEYRIGKGVVEYIYAPYVCHLERVKTRLLNEGYRFDPHGLIVEANVQHSLWGMSRKWAKRFLRFDQQFRQNNFNVVHDLRKFMRRFGAPDLMAQFLLLQDTENNKDRP